MVPLIPYSLSPGVALLLSQQGGVEAFHMAVASQVTQIASLQNQSVCDRRQKSVVQPKELSKALTVPFPLLPNFPH